MHTWLFLSTIALVFWGITGVTQKLSTNNISFERSFVWFALAFFVQAGLIALTMPLRWDVPISVVALAAVGGLLNGLGALTSFAALERGGKASVVIPIISIYPLFTVAGAWLLLGEQLTVRQGVGIVCALGSVFLLSREAEPASTTGH
jgi:bacterial/archaeal transporter family protein